MTMKRAVWRLIALRSRRHTAVTVAGLEDAGLRLSPSTGVVLEDVLRQSRLCLNFHSHRSRHLDYPRMLGAYATGAALLTESSFGMDRLFPHDVYVSVTYRGLIREAVALLGDKQKIQSLALNGADMD